MSTMMRFLVVSLLLGSVLLSGYQVLASGPAEPAMMEARCEPSDCGDKCDPAECRPEGCTPQACPRR